MVGMKLIPGPGPRGFDVRPAVGRMSIDARRTSRATTTRARRRDEEMAMNKQHAQRGAAAAAVLGGLVWTAGAVGWLMTHGTQLDWNNAELFGLDGTRFTQLLILAAGLWAI